MHLLRVLRVLAAVPGHLAGGGLAGLRGRHPEEGEDALEAADIATVVAAGRGAGQPTLGTRTRQDRLRRQAELQVSLSEIRSSRRPSGRFRLARTRSGGTGTPSFPNRTGAMSSSTSRVTPSGRPSSGLFFLFGLWYQVDGEWTYERPMGP